MAAFEVFEHAGFVVELHPDWDDPSSPADWDTLGTLYAFSARDGLGYRVHPPRQEEAPGDVAEAWGRERPGLTVRYLRARGELAVLCRFEDYGSGARLRVLDDDEDERATGYLSTTPARVAELCGTMPDGSLYRTPDWEGDGASWVRHALDGELGEWSSYVAGEVVGVVVRDEDGAMAESVWGFYPDRSEPGDGLEYVREEGRAMAESCRDEIEARRQAVARGWAVAHGLVVA